ncbi:MAG TPA: recombinase RecT [Oligella sp.]|nr:recombinase RecT [Oligella sp.]
MAVTNSLTTKTKGGTFSVFMSGDNVRRQINAVVGKDSQMFITSIMSAVSANPTLQECEHGSLLSCALLGQSLKLSPSPTLGQFYIVPFKDKKAGIKKAQFILGYKGYIQLAIRSGQYADIDCIEIREGECLGRDSYTGKYKFSFIENEIDRLNAPIIGYLAYFELSNGFRKQVYWSKERLEKHADSYSMAFNIGDYQKLKDGKIPQSDMWKYSSFWYKNFDEMAYKTLLRHLISRWGIMSIEMQKAFDTDIAKEVENDSGMFESVPTSTVEAIEEAQEAEPTSDDIQDDFFGDKQ